MSCNILPPIVVFSDLHLKSWDNWDRELERLRGLWENAKTIILNGDTLSWRIAKHPDIREKMRNDITDYFHRNGLETIFVAGNSDQEITGQDYHFLCGEKILALHGHAIFDDVSPWNYCASQLKQNRRQFLESTSKPSRNTLDAYAQSARSATIEIQQQCLKKHCKTRAQSFFFLNIHKFRTLLRIGKILKSWKNTPKLAAGFLELYAPETKFLIMGHTHRSGVWKPDGRVIINTGSIRNHRHALLVQLENDTLKVFRIRRNKKQLILGQLVEEFAV